jgi:hypothetical protein
VIAGDILSEQVVIVVPRDARVALSKDGGSSWTIAEAPAG